MASPAETAIAVKITRFKELLPRIIMAGSQIPAWFTAVVGGKSASETFSFLPDWVDIQSSLLLIAVSILLLIIGVYLEAKREHSIARSEEELEESLRVHAAVDSSIDGYLSNLTDELGLTSEGQSLLADRKAVRTSLYMHHPSEKSFIPVCRHSTNPRFKGIGRGSYPDDQGLISSAWEDDWAYAKDLPEDREKWNAKMSSSFNIPSSVASAFKMQSRSMASICLKADREKVGVIVIESVLPEGIPADIIDSCYESDTFNSLTTLMPLLNAKNEYENGR